MKIDLFAPVGPVARPFEWLVDPLTADPSFLLRPMFGVHGCYLRGRLVLVLCGKREEPWHGLLVPTTREHHASLRREHPALAPHEVLGKWLYLPASTDDFERTANRLVDLVALEDERIGVEPRSRTRMPEPRRSRTRTKSRPRKRATK